MSRLDDEDVGAVVFMLGCGCLYAAGCAGGVIFACMLAWKLVSWVTK